MPKTIVRENETIDDALRRFKRQVNKAGTLTEAKKREFYLKPGLKRKMKSEMARRKSYQFLVNLQIQTTELTVVFLYSLKVL